MAAFDYDLERERIARNRKVAEAMLLQSMQPMGGTETVGGIAVRKSPLEGIAKVAQAYMGRQGVNASDEQSRDLGQQQRADVTGAVDEFTRATTPRAAVASALQEDAAGNVDRTDAQPAYAPGAQDRRAAAMQLMSRLGGDPKDTAKLMVAQALSGAGGNFDKIDPSKYTPASLKAYSESGDVSVLVPRVRAEFVNGQAVDPYATPPGAVIPQQPPEAIRTLQAAGLKQGTPEWDAAMKDLIAKTTKHAPAPSAVATANTEKGYATHFAGKVAEQDVAMLDAARKAPDLAERSNRILQTLAGGKVITGAGADFRLAAGKALNLVGASDADTIANTEALSAELASSTLDAIKASGLGSGSGFSNADREFLEKAKGGKITLEGATLKRLAQLSHRAAEKTADAWGKRVKNIPDSALTGTGIKRDPISVPGMFGGAPAVSPETQMLLDKYAPQGDS